jgi:hypothetical protein
MRKFYFRRQSFLGMITHGGTDDWNRSEENSLKNIRSQYPVKIAFGMADAGSIEKG